MTTLQAKLSELFKPPRARKPDPCRAAREWAKPVAAEYKIEIEPLKPGFNVWPPAALAKLDGWVDLFDGDHYCQDWDEVMDMVKDYAHECGRLRVLP